MRSSGILLLVISLTGCVTAKNGGYERFYEEGLLTSDVKQEQVLRARSGGEIEKMLQNTEYTFSKDGDTSFVLSSDAVGVTTPDTTATITAAISAAVQSAIAAIVAQPGLANENLALGREQGNVDLVLQFLSQPEVLGFLNKAVFDAGDVITLPEAVVTE